ncbi:MAG: hypothetical protein K8U57_24505 [Planctomycetes bacterium]|nr:hypothetical protein [Planctomycetota bacterium]
MRVAVVVLIALTLASCGRFSDRRSVADVTPDSIRTDRLHGRAYLKPTRTHPDVLMQATNPTPVAKSSEGTESTSNLNPRPAVESTSASPTALYPYPYASENTGQSAIKQMTARSGQGRVTSLHFENGKSTLKFQYNDGSTGSLTSGGGPSEFLFVPGPVQP